MRKALLRSPPRHHTIRIGHTYKDSPVHLEKGAKIHRSLCRPSADRLDHHRTNTRCDWSLRLATSDLRLAEVDPPHPRVRRSRPLVPTENPPASLTRSIDRNRLPTNYRAIFKNESRGTASLVLKHPMIQCHLNSVFFLEAALDM